MFNSKITSYVIQAVDSYTAVAVAAMAREDGLLACRFPVHQTALTNPPHPVGVVSPCWDKMSAFLDRIEAEIKPSYISSWRAISSGRGRWPLSSCDARNSDTIVALAHGTMLGSKESFGVIAGPCGVESLGSIKKISKHVSDFGACALRGGAFKPRTNPYSFSGLGKAALEYLRQVGDDHSIPIVTEVMDPRDVDEVSDYADCLQVGARNMQNFDLLREIAKTKMPVLLKRGMSATLSEFLQASDYILSGGNGNVILCERGIRTFESSYRNVLDINAIVWLKQHTHLPVIADPSHGCGERNMVIPLALAAAAAGADGIIVEVHDDPERALSDGPQQLLPDMFSSLMGRLGHILKAVGKRLA